MGGPMESIVIIVCVALVVLGIAAFSSRAGRRPAKYPAGRGGRRKGAAAPAGRVAPTAGPVVPTAAVGGPGTADRTAARITGATRAEAAVTPAVAGDAAAEAVTDLARTAASTTAGDGETAARDGGGGVSVRP